MCKSIFGLAKKFGPAQNILRPVKGQAHFLYMILDSKKIPAPNLAFQAFERFIGT